MKENTTLEKKGNVSFANADHSTKIKALREIFKKQINDLWHPEMATVRKTKYFYGWMSKEGNILIESADSLNDILNLVEENEFNEFNFIGFLPFFRKREL
jgi:hypothetical protein